LTATPKSRFIGSKEIGTGYAYHSTKGMSTFCWSLTCLLSVVSTVRWFKLLCVDPIPAWPWNDANWTTIGNTELPLYGNYESWLRDITTWSNSRKLLYTRTKCGSLWTWCSAVSLQCYAAEVCPRNLPSISPGR
jgi:hypothetical protein